MTTPEPEQRPPSAIAQLAKRSVQDWCVDYGDDLLKHVREVLASSPTTALDRPTPASQD